MTIVLKSFHQKSRRFRSFKHCHSVSISNHGSTNYQSRILRPKPDNQLVYLLVNLKGQKYLKQNKFIKLLRPCKLHKISLHWFRKQLMIGKHQRWLLFLLWNLFGRSLKQKLLPRLLILKTEEMCLNKSGITNPIKVTSCLNY